MSSLSPQQFGDYSIEYVGHEKPWAGQIGHHQVVAKDSAGAQVGKMVWKSGSRIPGEVDDIRVKDEHRRKGLATAMWNYASSSGIKPSPKHSAQRTDEGDAWSKTIGGRRPRRDTR